MTLELMFDAEEDVTCALGEKDVRDVCELVLMQEGVERDCSVSVSVVGDDRIHELNLEWRDVDAPTDVISLECDRPDDPTLPPGVPCELGDIVLAPAYIARQAERVGTTERAETTLLLIHGMLHLLGYDHLEDDEAAIMEAREDELLAMALPNEVPGHVRLTRHGGDEL